MMHNEWIAIVPQVILASGGFVVFCLGAFWRRGPKELLFLLSLAAALGAGAAASWLAPEASSFYGMVDFGGYTRFFIVILSSIALISLLFAHHYARARNLGGDEFYGVLLFATLGMTLVVAALNWVVFFLGLELLSISLYILIAIQKADTTSTEAGVKYFIMGAVAGAFLTFGIALLYAFTGTLDIESSLSGKMNPGDLPGLLLALSLILVGIGFKTSLVPFHLWTPDVYEGAPAPVTAFLSTGSKVALFAALMRFLQHASNALWTYSVPVIWGPIWALAVLSMVVGNVTALGQTRLKRLLAYSSVAQMGYLFMALLAVKQDGIPAMMFYLAVYAAMDLGAFGIVGTFSAQTPDLNILEDFRGLGYSHPWRSAVLATCLFSLAGLPPTGGFIGKFLLFRAVLQAGFVSLAVIGVLTVILSIFFYMKVVVILYMKPPLPKGITIPGASFSGSLSCALIFVLILWMGVMPSPFLAVIARIFPFSIPHP
jgi:NADH-quinone oxidoreductase subunit N